jgi:hypothetical protein
MCCDFIGWARFGELFIYDETTHRMSLPPEGQG